MRMERKRGTHLRSVRDWIGGIILGGVLVGFVLTAMAADVTSPEYQGPFSGQALWLMRQTRAIIETYQVDGESKPVEEEKLVYGAIKGMVNAVGDPYTRFVNPTELKEEEIEITGEYGGLGMYVGQRDGRTLVISPIEDTPADKAGLKPQDQIIRIGDEVILGWDSQQVVKKLRGKPGTPVTIWVRRGSEEELRKFDLVRENIKIKSVRSEVMDKTIGYVKVSHFNQKTTEELKAALDDVLKGGAKGFILDLRNNGGGLLNSAVEICDMFLDDTLIVGMRGRIERANDEIYATPGKVPDLPMVVLINEGSASASEIVAGALMDTDRALSVGKKSFGKGSVQTLFRLTDGSGVYVTIARYYTPAGTVIDHVGLEPDVIVEGEVTKETEKDTQLKKAKEELKAAMSGKTRPRSVEKGEEGA